MAAAISDISHRTDDPTPDAVAAPPRGALVGFAAAIGMVAVAVLAAFIVRQLLSGAHVTLIFVLPVVVAATAFGFKPALVATGAGVLAFDFFFTQPFYSLRIHSASDLWAAALLLVIAAIVSTLAADTRRRAIAAEREAERAGALHDLARLVVEAAPTAEVTRSGAHALARIFQAPAVVLVQQGAGLEAVAETEGASLSSEDREAAVWVLAHGAAAQGDNFPFERSQFDFWPIRGKGAPGLVLGVLHGDSDTRPDAPKRYVELVGAYLAASLAGSRADA